MTMFKLFLKERECPCAHLAERKLRSCCCHISYCAVAYSHGHGQCLQGDSHRLWGRGAVPEIAQRSGSLSGYDPGIGKGKMRGLEFQNSSPLCGFSQFQIFFAKVLSKLGDFVNNSIVTNI